MTMSLVNTCQPADMPPLRMFQILLALITMLPVLLFLLMFQACAILSDTGPVFRQTYDKMTHDKDAGNVSTWGIKLPFYGWVTLSETMTILVLAVFITTGCVVSFVLACVCMTDSLTTIGTTGVIAAEMVDVVVTHWRTGGEHHLSAGQLIFTVLGVGIGLLVFNVARWTGFEIWGTLLVMLCFFFTLFVNRPNVTTLVKKYVAMKHLVSIAMTCDYTLLAAEMGTSAVMVATFEYVR